MSFQENDINSDSIMHEVKLQQQLQSHPAGCWFARLREEKVTRESLECSGCDSKQRKPTLSLSVVARPFLSWLHVTAPLLFRRVSNSVCDARPKRERLTKLDFFIVRKAQNLPHENIVYIFKNFFGFLLFFHCRIQLCVKEND